MSSELPADAPAPRLCHLVKWSDFDGYGFNLHAEKSRSGQFIGKVDEESPAMHAGLREGDRIIEVNGVNIAQENHRQVVERIKTNPGEARLLVVDEAADRWYKERKIVVKSTQPGVVVTKTPVPRPPTSSSPVEPPSYENISVPDEKSNGYENGEHSPAPQQKHDGNRHSNGSAVMEEEMLSPKEESSPQVQRAPPKEEVVSSRSSTPAENTSVPDSPHSTKSSRSTNSAGGGSAHQHNGHHQSSTATGLEEGMLNLNMSASEMRQMLANRRKKDPKKEPMDIRQKYEIIQQM